jgi:hypothetical protein
MYYLQKFKTDEVSLTDFKEKCLSIFFNKSFKQNLLICLLGNELNHYLI